MYLPAALPLHDHAHLLALADVDHVLGTELVRERWLAVAVEDLEVGEVDVHRVEPSTRRVLELPDLDVAAIRVGQRELEVAAPPRRPTSCR